MPDWLGIDDQRVLVAGGAGTLGTALVEGLLQEHARVAVIDSDGGRLNSLGDEVFAIHADLREADTCRAAVDEARKRLGGLDVFVHCVGVNDRKPVEAYQQQEWDAILEINLTSAFCTATAAAPPMREQGYGRIVLFSSVAGRMGHKLHAPYAASKGAINQLTRVMAHEYAAYGVTVNAVAPGYMDTALTAAYLDANPEKREALIDLIPAGRFARLEEIVSPVLFLVSPRASFINGQIIYIDGGRTVV